MADEKKAKAVDMNKFIARKLKVINRNPNEAKAKRDAERILRNKQEDVRDGKM